MVAGSERALLPYGLRAQAPLVPHNDCGRAPDLDGSARAGKQGALGAGHRMDLWTIGGIILAILFALVAGRVLLRRMRFRRLARKYDSDAVAADIVARRIWQGMSEEQLAESWGRPADIDTRVTKTKASATWKYEHLGGNRYGQRVSIENGVVTGWEIK